METSVIDFHCHVGCPMGHDPARYLRTMDDAGIDRSCINCIFHGDARRGNDLVARFVDKHPDRFIGLGTANPWHGEAALAELDRAIVDLGLSGFKFHSLIQGFHLNDPLFVYPLVEKAIDLDVPVYFHCGTPIMAVPYKMQDLAQLYPQAKLIMGHRGWDFHFDVIYVEQNCPHL